MTKATALLIKTRPDLSAHSQSKQNFSGSVPKQNRLGSALYVSKQTNEIALRIKTKLISLSSQIPMKIKTF